MSKKISNKNIFSIILASIFGVLFIASAWSFWSSLGNSLFGNGAQLGLTVKLPVFYYVISCVFSALTVALVILAYRLKSKLLALLPLIYQLVIIVSVICFAIIASNPNESVYIITIILFTLFAPLYGFCYLTYVWSLFLIIPLFFASIIVAFKVFKFHKEQNIKKK